LELGLDLMFRPSDNTLHKIIMHTNYPYHPFFGFHNRCCYELQTAADAVITHETKFAEVKYHMGESQLESKEFFVRNITNEFTTQYHAFKSIIFEVIPSNDLISSVTIFKV